MMTFSTCVRSRRRFIFLLFAGVVNTTQATTPQYLDSVEHNLRTTTVTLEKLNSLYTLSFEYGLIDPPKGISFGWRCLELAMAEKNLAYQLNAYNGIANGYETLGKFDSALYFHGKTFLIASEMKLPPKMALTLFNVALCHKQLGNYTEALSNYLEAYRILEKEPTYNPRIHFYLGEMYLKTGDLKSAMFHSRLGVAQCKKFNHVYIVYNLQVNLARCLMQENKNDSALAVLTTALAGLKTNTDKLSIALCLNALGDLYIKLGDLERAYQAFSEENVLHRELKNTSGTYLAKTNRAYVLALNSTVDESAVRGLLHEAEQDRFLLKGNIDVLGSSYERTAKAYEKIGDWRKALQIYKLFYAIKDSVLGVEKFRQLNELQTRYETEKKQHQINLLTQSDLLKSEQLRNRNIILLLGLLLAALGAALMYFYFQRRIALSRLEKERTVKLAEEAERLRLARDVHDDLGSGLSKINFLSELLMKDAALNKASFANATAVSETAKRLVINMRDLIWALNPENTTLAGLVARIREYSSDYLEDCPLELKLDIQQNLSADQISKESHRQVLMVVKETLNNVVKHSGTTWVEITVKVQDGQFLVSVKDNGKGFDTSSSIGNGLGNMRSRIGAIGGEFFIRSQLNQGTHIQVAVPLSGMQAG